MVINFLQDVSALSSQAMISDNSFNIKIFNSNQIISFHEIQTSFSHKILSIVTYFFMYIFDYSMLSLLS
jgi:hypothetical protein